MKYPDIVFLKTKRSGASILRGDQICSYMKNININSQTIYEKNLKNIKNCILFSIKKDLNSEVVDVLKKRNVKIVLDIVDLFSNIKNEKINLCNKYDAIIYPNNKCLKDFFVKDSFCSIIDHHIHEKINKIEYGSFKNVKFGYFGIFKSCSYINKNKNIDKINPIKDKFWIEKLKRYNCHISLRSYDFSKYKPNTKLAVASGSGSNIIMTKDEGFLDKLKEYPFYVDDDEKSFEHMANFVKENYNSKIWHKALDQINSIREDFLLKNIIKKYLNLIENIA